MRRFFIYFILQVKRAFKALPAVLVTAVIISGCIGLMFVMMKKIGNLTDPDEALKIGIVGDSNDEYFSVGLAAIKHFDSSRFAVDLLQLSEEEADSMLRSGKISGYAVIPEGFVDSVMTGENKRITIYTSYGSKDLMSGLVIEFMDQISGYLLETQNSIHGLTDYIRDEGTEDKLSYSIYEINQFYINLVLKRDDLFEPLVIVDEGNTVSMSAGFICGLTIFLIMLFGITCSPLYTRRELSLNAVLRSRGLPLIFQVLAEYLSYIIMMIICILPIICCIVYAIHSSGIVITEWEQRYIEDYLYFIRGYVPVIVLFSSMQYMLFLSADNYIAGVSLQFICAVILAYIGGCLYPLSFFPEVVRKSALFQPAGIAYRYLADILLVNDTSPMLVRMLIYTFIFIAAAYFIMKGRLVNED